MDSSGFFRKPVTNIFGCSVVSDLSGSVEFFERTVILRSIVNLGISLFAAEKITERTRS